MRIWTAFKILSALIVIAFVAMSVLFTMHVLGKKIPQPATDLFSRYMPEPAPLLADHDTGANDEHLKMLEQGEMTDIEPGDKAFQKAAELLATGQIPTAREKLLFLINYYPTSNAAPAARRILGEMNMDDFLAIRNNPHITLHKVQRGNSYLAIAAKYQTTLDCIMHVNAYLELRPLQPGDELNVMPLNLRITIEPSRSALTLTHNNTFLKEYTIYRSISPPTATLTTTIDNKGGAIGTKKISPGTPGYRAAAKTITLGKGYFILPHDPANEAPARGFHLHPADTEELALLLRVGNEVEIRK